MLGSENRNRRRRNIQKVAFGILWATATLNLLALVGFLLFIAVNGISAINWEFLSEMPRNAMTEGGILPTILGTLYLSLGAILVAFPIGVGTAIYLNEFARDGFWVRMIRQGVVNLAGVPSVVYGLFGLAFFVIIMKLGVSIIAGSLTLGISRAAGETAPIMFTAAVFSTAKLPTSIFDEVMAMPYHIYVLATSGTNIEETRHLQYGTALLLLLIVVVLNLFAILLRNRLQKRYKSST